MNTKYIYIKKNIFLLLVYIKEIPKVIDASLEARLKKIEDILDSNLIKILAYGSKSFTKGG